MQHATLADHRVGRLAESGENSLHHRVGLGVNRGRIQRVVATLNSKKAGSLLEGLVSQARHLTQCLATCKRTLGIAMLNDALGHRSAKPGNTRQQRRRCRVEVDTDRIDAILDHCIEASGQFTLIDIMLILADPNGFGIDFDQLSQGILQPSGDRDRASQAHIDLRKLACCKGRGRIDRCARLRNRRLGQAQLRVAFLQVASQPIRLP